MLKEFKTETEDRQDFGEKDPIGEDKDEEEDEKDEAEAHLTSGRYLFSLCMISKKKQNYINIAYIEKIEHY